MRPIEIEEVVAIYKVWEALIHPEYDDVFLDSCEEKYVEMLVATKFKDNNQSWLAAAKIVIGCKELQDDRHTFEMEQEMAWQDGFNMYDDNLSSLESEDIADDIW